MNIQFQESTIRSPEKHEVAEFSEPDLFDSTSRSNCRLRLTRRPSLTELQRLLDQESLELPEANAQSKSFRLDDPEEPDELTFLAAPIEQSENEEGSETKREACPATVPDRYQRNGRALSTIVDMATQEEATTKVHSTALRGTPMESPWPDLNVRPFNQVEGFNIALEREAVEQMKCTLPNLVHCLKQIFIDLNERIKDANVILTVGLTGTGKSTLVNSMVLGPDSLHSVTLEEDVRIKRRDGTIMTKKKKRKVIDVKEEVARQQKEGVMKIGHSH